MIHSRHRPNVWYVVYWPGGTHTFGHIAQVATFDSSSTKEPLNKQSNIF